MHTDDVQEEHVYPGPFDPHPVLLHLRKKPPTVRICRRVKTKRNWVFATIARIGDRMLWDHVLIDKQPQKVDGGSFYLVWTENGVKHHRSVATLDPTTALQAKAELERELGHFAESATFTRLMVEPVCARDHASIDRSLVFGYVYKVTHKASGRVYIGQTRNMVILRWREHARAGSAGAGSAFQRALHQYGAEAFIFETIGSARSKVELDAIERRWIASHQATNPEFGFNIRD